MEEEKKKTGGKLLGFKIERMNPETDAKTLAERMASKMSFELAARGDAREYRTAAKAERTKGTAITQAIFAVKEWRKNPPDTVSRMEPMLTYDIPSMERELEEYKKKAIELDRLAAERDDLAGKAHHEAVALQGRIRQINRGADVDVIPVDALIPKGRRR